MIKTSFKESFRLIGRSKPECLAYLAVICLSGALEYALPIWTGVDFPVQDAKPGAAKLAYMLAFTAPGYVFAAWAGAGLVGRISIDALTGAPASMISYANGWFLRNLKGSVVVVAAVFLPIVLMLLLPMALAAVIILAWFLFFVWFAIRISLWGSIMFIDGLGPFAAMRRSYSVSEGHTLSIALLSVPLFVGMLFEIGSGHFVTEGLVSEALLKPLLLGAATLVQIGALAAAYLAIKKTKVTEPS
jgi:hypothetical protein